MVLFDSHCHLNDEAFQDDLDEVVSRAQEAGLKAVLVLGYDIPSSRKAIAIAEKYEICYAGVGIHCQNIEGATLDDLKTIEELSYHPKVIAIGEVGLDYYWDKTEQTKQRQKPFFIEQIKLANKRNLPLSIHAREALQDAYTILKGHRPNAGAVMHCYSGSVEQMRELSKLGLYFGFDGPITYKNARVPKECVAEIPLNRLLTETDSPYLSPTPLRGTRNEPKNIALIFEEMAKIKGCSLSELETELNRNFKNLFHVKL